MTEKELKLAAGFVYKHRNTGYWTYPILVFDVSRHPETEKLKFSMDDASAVFAALETQGFLQKQNGEMLDFGPAKIQKYRIDYSKLKDLWKYSEIPWYYFLPPSVVYYLEKYYAWFIVCVALILTSFFQGFVGKLGEWIGDKITK